MVVRFISTAAEMLLSAAFVSGVVHTSQVIPIKFGSGLTPYAVNPGILFWSFDQNASVFCLLLELFKVPKAAHIIHD